MSRLSLLIDFAAYEGAASNDPQDVDKIKSQLDIADINEIHRLKETVVDTTVDRSIALPDPATDMAIIFTDQEISLKINSGQSEVFKPTKAGCKTLIWIMKGAITSLEVSNSSGKDAKLDIILVNI